MTEIKKDDIGSKVITQEIILQLRDGSHSAYEKIFVAYYGKIKYFINGFIKSEETAQELAQDIFLKLWERRESIDPEKSLGYFMYTMARNATFNFLKHKLVHSTYVSRFSAGEHLELSTEEKVYANEIGLIVAMAVKKMPSQRRKIYELSRHEGLTNDEIATKLGLSKKTVENQLSIALKELKKVISVFMVTICCFVEHLWL